MSRLNGWRASALALTIPLGSCACACSLLHQDTGRYKSLPALCSSPQDSPGVKAAVDSVFDQLPGDHTLNENSAKLPEFLEHTGFSEELRCMSETDTREPRPAGSPKSRTLYVDFKRLIPGQQHGDDSAQAAARLLKPNPIGMHGAIVSAEPGIGDEAFSWWSTNDPDPKHSWREIVFRVSNMNVDVTLTGSDYTNATDPLDMKNIEGDGSSPQLREDLQRKTLAVAKALAAWLQNDWKG